MKECNIGGILLALFILAWGIVWLGNDCGWWKFVFPFWPVVIILVGLGILIHELTKMKKNCDY
jgi:hypothetical protein